MDNVLMLSSRSPGREKSARIPLTRILKKKIARRAVQPCLVYEFSVLYAINYIYVKTRVKRTISQFNGLDWIELDSHYILDFREATVACDILFHKINLMLLETRRHKKRWLILQSRYFQYGFFPPRQTKVLF